MARSAGVLMPITSLPSKFGIGTMGEAARKFIDFLEEAGQTWWQILPLGPTGYGDSPYQAFSSYAGNPYLIDLDDLKDAGLLDTSDYTSEDWGADPERVDYGQMYEHRFKVLKLAVQRFMENPPEDYETFLREESDWLPDYALFMAIKEEQGGRSWLEWPEELRRHQPEALREASDRLAEKLTFWKVIQYLFFRQWEHLSKYAHQHHVRIIGDLPIYVSPDSADAWADARQFQLDRDGRPTEVSGCPPDGFAADGQLWGNPLYDWDYMKTQGYDWWIRRIRYQFRLVDKLRIDHFRGFESYFAIPYGDKTARNGVWKKGPGMDLFRAIGHALGKVDLIAEDLGYLTPEVIQMVKDSGFPGMKVLQFAFDTRDTGTGYLPYQYTRNSVAYTGTHDNETVNGWIATAPRKDVELAERYLHLDPIEGAHWGFIRAVYGSVSDLAIIPMQDFLGLGHEARINTPSTTGNNWTWRASEDAFTPELARKIKDFTELYGRKEV